MQTFFRKALDHILRFAEQSPSAFLLLAYVLVFLPLYAPLLTGISVLVPGDTLGFNYPALKALQPFSIDSLLADPFTGRGFPWLATYGTLDPIAHLLRLVFNEYLTLIWLCFIYFILGAWLFSLFLQRSGRSLSASFIGGFLYMGAYFWVAEGDYPIASSLPFYAGMILTTSFLRTHPYRACIVLSAITAYAWLAGHFNYVPLIIAAVSIFVLADAVLSSKCALLPRLKPLALFCVSVGIGSMVGLLKVLPALAFVNLSERASGLSVAAASGYSLPLSVLYTAFFPYMNVPFVNGEIGLMFYGAAGLALLIIGLLQRERSVRMAILGFALCVLIAMPYSPLYAIIQHLPFFSFLRTPRRWLFIGNACMAFIAASALDNVTSGKVRFVGGVGKAMLWVGIVAAVGSLIVTGIDLVFGQQIVSYAQQYFDAHFYAQTSGLPLDHYHRHIAKLWQESVLNVSPLSPRFLLPLLGILLTGWVLLKGKYSARVLISLVIASLLPSFFFYYPKTSMSHLAYARQVWEGAEIGDAHVLPVLSGLADQTLRTGAVGDRPEERALYQLGLLVPNTHSLAGIRSVDFYQPLQPTRMARLLAALGSSSAPAPMDERLALSKASLKEKIATFAKRIPLLERMGVSYVTSAWELPEPFIRHGSLSFVDRLPAIQLYRVPNPRPLAAIPSEVFIQQPSEDDAIAYVRDSESSDLLYIECAQCTPGLQEQSFASITDLKETNTSVSMHVEAGGDAFLQVLRPRLPGWRAYIDGEAVPTAISDAQFFGVLVPAGSRDVEVKINYPSLLIDSAKMVFCKCDPWLL